jgi:hypothetical protein
MDDINNLASTFDDNDGGSDNELSSLMGGIDIAASAPAAQQISASQPPVAAY